MGACCSSSEAIKYDTDEALTLTNSSNFPLLFEDVVNCVCSCGGGELLAGGEDKTLARYRWEHPPSVPRRWLGHGKGVNRVVFDGASRTAYTASRDMTIRAWYDPSDTEPLERGSGQDGGAALATFEGHEMTVSALALLAGGGQLASGGRDTMVKLWDTATAKQLHSNSIQRNLSTAMVAVAGSEHELLQSSEDLTIRLWDTRTMKPEVVFKGYSNIGIGLDASPDGCKFITSHKGFNSVGTELRIWDLRAAAELAVLRGHEQAVTDVAYTDGGKHAVSCSNDMSVRLWDLSATDPSLVERCSLPINSKGGLAYIPDPCCGFLQ